MAEGDTWLNAIVGAVVTVILSFTGFSPLLGGAVAGYLQRGDPSAGLRVGALSGAIATVPFLFLFFFVFGAFLFAVPMMGDGMGRVGLAGGVGGVVFLFVFVFVAIWNVALSALGGYVGAYVALDTDVGADRTDT